MSTFPSHGANDYVRKGFNDLLERANRVFEAQLARNEENQKQVWAQVDELRLLLQRVLELKEEHQSIKLMYERERHKLQQQLHDIHLRTTNPPIDHIDDTTNAPREKRVATGALADLDVKQLAPEFKKVCADWQAIFNPDVRRVIDVEMVCTIQYDSFVCCIAFSPDGARVATGCDQTAQVFDAYLGTNCSLVHPCGQSGISDSVYIRSICFSPNGQYLATGCEDQIIRVWNLQTRRLYRSFADHTDQVYSLAFTPDSRLLVSGSSDATVRIWNIDNGTIQNTFLNNEGITSVAVSPDGQWVAAGSYDKGLHLWSIPSGEPLATAHVADAHTDSIYAVSFMDGGRSLVTGSLDSTIALWDLAAAITARSDRNLRISRRRELTGHQDFVLCVAATPDSDWVFSGSKDRAVQIWDPRTGAPHVLLLAHSNSVLSVATSSVVGYFATASGDKTARVWRYSPRSGHWHSNMRLSS